MIQSQNASGFAPWVPRRLVLFALNQSEIGSGSVQTQSRTLGRARVPPGRAATNRTGSYAYWTRLLSTDTERPPDVGGIDAGGQGEGYRYRRLPLAVPAPRRRRRPVTVTIPRGERLTAGQPSGHSALSGAPFSG
jgi:hypothetical protein